MKTTEKKPKVSVCVVTYNQEKYIHQCLQSIVDQQTNFDFEVIVSDDCSTDRTQVIIKEFAEKYPSLIKPIFHKENIGAYKNFVFVHSQATGEYIAHVDGDDYCLPGKLLRQADMLDLDPDCNIIFHRMQIMTPMGEIKEGPLVDVRNIGEMRFNRGALIQYMALGLHSSKMYRAVVRDFELPNFDVIDYFVNVEQVGTGYARFIGADNFGVYRMGIGIASGGAKTRKLLADSFLYFWKKYPENRAEVNTAVLTYLVADLKNCRRTWPMFFFVWLKTFHINSIFNLTKSLGFIKQLRLVK
jgi:glycosyltransferase involved in cell wall biosynthesis